MKKLMMFAAAMTIVGGAYAQCNDPEIILGDCMLTYNVKMNLRTVTGKGYKAIQQNVCKEDEVEGGCIRFPRIGLTLDGYLFYCNCDCDLVDADCLALGNKKLQTMLTGVDFAFEFIHILGNGKSAEASWALETTGDAKGLIGPIELAGTGFGTFNTKNNIFTGFSGMTVGYLAEPQCIALNDCEPAFYWLCDGTMDNEDASIIYGTWGMKLNTKFSGLKPAGNIGTLLKAAFPAWAYAQFDAMEAFDCLFGAGQ